MELSYRDEEEKVFQFPPPNASAQRFIDEEITSIGILHGGFDNSLPVWFCQLVHLKEASFRSAPPQIPLLGESLSNSPVHLAGVGGVAAEHAPVAA